MKNVLVSWIENTILFLLLFTSDSDVNKPSPVSKQF